VYVRRVLVGREREMARFTALVEAARNGTAGCVVVRGEPGIGKSVLIDEAVAAVGEATVLRTQGLEVEAPLAFAALHRLLRPLDRLRGQLPGPQARALRVAFGEEDGTSVEPFLIGVATLSLLTAAAEESLVVCVVDDAHWLDAATAAALLFSARRLGADRVAMVFAAREGEWAGFDPQGLAEIVLTGLDDQASRALLADRWGEAPAIAVTDRLIAETRGNPLALVELPSELTPSQLQGTSELPAQLHLTDRVEQVFLDRSRRLPATVQSVLLLAAADDTGDLDTIRRASNRLGLPEAALPEAVASGLLVSDATSCSVRHPLVRSAIYQAATASERRQVHLALAEVLAGSGDPDRETWHRAFAAEGPDQSLVSALELVGTRALRRGGYVAALAAYERAAGLSTDQAQRAGLTFAAARSAWACGQAAHAQALLTTARELSVDPLLLCDIARVRGHIEVNVGSAPEAHRIFVEAAHAVLASDPGRALETGVAAAVMRTFGADSGTPLRAADLLAATEADQTARTRCLRHLLVAMTHTAQGEWRAAVEALDLALDVGEQVDDRDVLWNLGNAALQLGDDRRQQQFYSFALSRAREAGAVTAVVYCLQRLCFGYYLAGDLVALRVAAEEALALASSIGQRAMTALPVAWLTMLAALQGSDEYDDLVQRLEEVVAASPLGITADPVHDLARWAAGIRAAGAGDATGALHQLTRLRVPVFARMADPERIEAATRCHEIEAARDRTEELARFAESTGRRWALASVAFGRALTAEPDEAEAYFAEALSHHALADRPLDQARTRLAYGEWLRRAQRRVDARTHLRHAAETFQDLRAEALADRANQELRASGETARKRDPSTLVDLTQMELKVAQLVSSGMSNKEVAAQCWISPRTVAFHLRNVFAKAGITSRGELARLDLG
jgi:DNA-binding CsgD family transcriptional regulator/tetratricopeptide (TPR) repeat protein